MINIFHGDDVSQSRQAFLAQLKSDPLAEVLRLDPKNIDLDIINNFLQGNSLFSDHKILGIENFFSIHKATQEKILKLLKGSECEICIWQDKNLTPVQVRSFSKPNVRQFKLDNQLFACLNAVKPGNLNKFLGLYHQVINSDLYDLFLYLLKGNLRRQLSSFSRFDLDSLKKVYLQLIELDYQNKTGQLTVPKEISLERIMLNLLK